MAPQPGLLLLISPAPQPARSRRGYSTRTRCAPQAPTRRQRRVDRRGRAPDVAADLRCHQGGGAQGAGTVERNGLSACAVKTVDRNAPSRPSSDSCERVRSRGGSGSIGTISRFWSIRRRSTPSRRLPGAAGELGGGGSTSSQGAPGASVVPAKPCWCRRLHRYRSEVDGKPTDGTSPFRRGAGASGEKEKALPRKGEGHRRGCRDRLRT